MKKQTSNAVILAIVAIALSACTDEFTEKFTIPATKGQITVVANLVEGPNSTTEGFDLANWFRDHYGIVVDSASFIYPELQVVPNVSLESLKIEAIPFGMKQFDGALNQVRIEKVAVESTGDTIQTTVGYKYFLGSKNEKRAKKKLAENVKVVKAEFAEALTYYELALEEAIAQHASLKIPGKKPEGGTTVYTYVPGDVNVECVEKAEYSLTSSRYHEKQLVNDLVQKTGCVATVNYYLSN